jgi:hypothetical protein
MHGAVAQDSRCQVAVKSREIAEGCYVCVAQATLPGGRQDESIGAVSIDGLKGELRANALMRAETKAKRRVTLSICGLAFLDESEVDSVRGACHVAIDPQTGEVLSSDPPRTTSSSPAAPEAKAPLEQAGSPRPWRTFKEMLERFAELKQRLSLNEELYYEVLAQFEIRHANEFRDARKAAVAYSKLLAQVEEYEAAQEAAMTDAMNESAAPAPEEEATP